MIGLGPHAAYIMAAYLGTALAIAALCLRLLRASRRVKKRLAALEAAGTSRRSGGEV